jgi:hypothetical protein
LHISVFNDKLDDNSCIKVILGLLNLYREARDVNPGSFEEIRAIKDMTSDSIERLSAEKSQLYLGYKILWVIRLLLNGKMFP